MMLGWVDPGARINLNRRSTTPVVRLRRLPPCEVPMLVWLSENKEWVFSGIGATVLAGVIALLRRSKPSSQQEQHGGEHSVNIQVGGDVNRSDKKHDRPR